MRRGRLPVPRVDRLAFWDGVRAGLPVREAAAVAGAERTAEQWFRAANPQGFGSLALYLVRDVVDVPGGLDRACTGLSACSYAEGWGVRSWTGPVKGTAPLRTRKLVRPVWL